MAKPWEQDWNDREKKKGGKPWEQDWSAHPVGLLDSTRPLNSLDAFLSGAGDALSFGFGDEGLGALKGAGTALSGGDFWDTYNKSVDESRRWQDSARTDPWAFGAGQLGGSIAGGVGIGGLARLGLGGAGALANIGKNVTPMGRIALSAALGGAGGAIYGAGSARDPSETLNEAMGGAAWGAGTGGLFRGAGEAFSPIFKRIGNNLSPKARLSEYVVKKWEESGQPAGELAQRIADAPDNALAVDIIPGGTQVVMGAAARPSLGKETFRQVLDDRNNAMADNAADDLWKSTGHKRIDAGRRIMEIQEAKKAIDYADIDRGVLDPAAKGMNEMKDFAEYHLKYNGKFKGAIEDAIGEMEIEKSGSVAGLRQVGGEQALKDWMYHPKFWRTVWSHVREDVAQAKKAAKMGSPLGNTQGMSIRSLQQDANEFRKHVGVALGTGWEAKQSAYKALATEEGALNEGYTSLKRLLNQGGDINLGKFLTKFNRMDDTQKNWVRQGSLAAVEDVMNATGTSGRADVLRALIGNKAKISVLNHILGRVTKEGGVDQRYAFAGVLKRMEQQRRLFENSVKSGIGVNSHTADKLLANDSLVENTRPTAGGITGAAYNVLTKGSKDRYDEAVANEALKLMSMPKAELQRQLAAIPAGGGGFAAMLRKKTALEMALAAQKNRANFRQNEFANVLKYAPFANVGFAEPIKGFVVGGQ